MSVKMDDVNDFVGKLSALAQQWGESAMTVANTIANFLYGLKDTRPDLFTEDGQLVENWAELLQIQPTIPPVEPAAPVVTVPPDDYYGTPEQNLWVAVDRLATAWTDYRSTPKT